MARVADASAPFLRAADSGGGGSTQTTCMPATSCGERSPAASQLLSASSLGQTSGACARAKSAGQSTPSICGHSAQPTTHTPGSAGPGSEREAAERVSATLCLALSDAGSGAGAGQET
eukprot:scaffold59154_cov31-Tisochrysis_lutea.AAC.2